MLASQNLNPTGPLAAALVVLVAFLALLVGCITGLLSWVSGAPPAAAIIRGGAAFGGTIGLAIALFSALL